MQKNEDGYLNIDNFILQNQFGQGSFSKVYKVKEKETGKIFAAKVSKEKFDETKLQHMYISSEINIMSRLDHPAVLKFIGYSPIDFKKRNKPVIFY